MLLVDCDVVGLSFQGLWGFRDEEVENFSYPIIKWLLRFANVRSSLYRRVMGDKYGFEKIDVNSMSSLHGKGLW